MDSEITVQKLERAARELLERDGVLGGLNLREVADHDRVDRGLVCHYFGSRQDLLRSALRRNPSLSAPDRLRKHTDKPVRWIVYSHARRPRVA